MCITNALCAVVTLSASLGAGIMSLRQTESEPRIPERNWTFGYQLNEAVDGPNQAAEKPVGSVILRIYVSEKSLISVKMCREGPHALLRMIRV